MVAARRCPTIRDNVMKNRFFSKDTGTSRPPFKACKSSRCLTCPIYKSSGSVMINSVVFNISNKFNCKTDGGGGFTTLNYTIHKKRQKCSVKQCNLV